MNNKNNSNENISKTDPIENKVNLIKNLLESEVKRYRDAVFNNLLDNPVINNIPESLFVNYFLPCFIGRSNNSNWVLEWISIAGSPMAEVGVFDDNTKELLYIVPSILNSNNMFLNKSEGDIGDILTRYDQINSNNPMQGLGFLIDALNNKNSELFNKINFNDVNNRWISILSRYNLITNENTVTKTKNTDLDNVLDF